MNYIFVHLLDNQVFLNEHKYMQNKSGLEAILQLFTWVFAQYIVIRAPVKYTSRAKYT
jgi:hypothetical protein